MERDTLVWDKEKVKLIVGSMVKNDNNQTFSYYEELIPFHFENDPDRLLIQDKMDNIMALLNGAATNEDGLTRIMNMDFEDEMWNII